jgi:hypothetical protein
VLNKAEAGSSLSFAQQQTLSGIPALVQVLARHQSSRDGDFYIVKIEGYNVKTGFVGLEAWCWKYIRRET